MNPKTPFGADAQFALLAAEMRLWRQNAIAANKLLEVEKRAYWASREREKELRARLKVYEDADTDLRLPA